MKTSPIASIFLLVLIGLVVHASATRAVETSKIVIQFNSMLVPSDNPNQRGKYTTVTPLILARFDVPATEVCKNSVRINEAILMTLSSHPVNTLVDEQYILPADVTTLLLDRVNRVIGSGTNREHYKIVRIHIQAGAVSMGSGVSARLPYATVTGCKQILDMAGQAATPDTISGENKGH